MGLWCKNIGIDLCALMCSSRKMVCGKRDADTERIPATWLPLCLCPCLPCPLLCFLPLFLWPRATRPPQVTKLYKERPVILTYCEFTPAFMSYTTECMMAEQLKSVKHERLRERSVSSFTVKHWRPSRCRNVLVSLISPLLQLFDLERSYFQKQENLYCVVGGPLNIKGIKCCDMRNANERTRTCTQTQRTRQHWGQNICDQH